MIITIAIPFLYRFNIKQLNYSEVAKYAVVQYTPNKPIWGKVARYVCIWSSIVITLGM